MRCADAEFLLSQFMDSDCDEQAAQELNLHLKICGSCSEIIANLLLVRAICRVARGQWGKTQTCEVRVPTGL
jgi:hypothetical protein